MNLNHDGHKRAVQAISLLMDYTEPDAYRILMSMKEG